MFPTQAKRSDVEIELINEFKKFDLTRQRSQESVPPSRFKIKATKQESTPSPPTRPTRIVRLDFEVKIELTMILTF